MFHVEHCDDSLRCSRTRRPQRLKRRTASSKAPGGRPPQGKSAFQMSYPTPPTNAYCRNVPQGTLRKNAVLSTSGALSEAVGSPCPSAQTNLKQGDIGTWG